MLIAAAICGGFLVSSPMSAAAERSTYSGGQLDIKEVTLTDSGKVQITFNTMPETLYYCPGANGETTARRNAANIRSFLCEGETVRGLSCQAQRRSSET